MLNYLKIYIIALIVFLLIDLLWLGVIAKNLYQDKLGAIMTPKPNLIAALIFYLIFIFGLVYFVIIPGINNNDFIHLVISALIFGLVTYATFDLTALALINKFTWDIAIIDLFWGMIVSTSTSVITFYILKVIGG